MALSYIWVRMNRVIHFEIHTFTGLFVEYRAVIWGICDKGFFPGKLADYIPVLLLGLFCWFGILMCTYTYTHTKSYTQLQWIRTTHPCVWHDSSMCVTWLIHVCDMTHPCVWHDSSMCVTWLIHVCDMTHPCVWHDSSMCATWLIHACDMTHPCVRHDSSMRVTWLIHVCDMTL